MVVWSKIETSKPTYPLKDFFEYAMYFKISFQQNCLAHLKIHICPVWDLKLDKMAHLQIKYLFRKTPYTRICLIMVTYHQAQIPKKIIY